MHRSQVPRLLAPFVLAGACGDSGSGSGDAGTQGSTGADPGSATVTASASDGPTQPTDASADTSASDGSTSTPSTSDSAESGDTTASDDTAGTTGEPGGCAGSGELAYDVTFSTYLGGAANWEHARDTVVDAAGNIYIAGGTQSTDFPVTPGAYDTSFGNGGNAVGSDGYSDAFVAKFTPDGQLEWATYLGGPNYDRAYAIELDPDGFVIVSGRSGPGFPTTPGAFQTEYLGNDAGIYGTQNGFVAKLSPDGDELVWSSQIGVAHLVRDFHVDDAGDIYAVMAFAPPSATQGDPAWLAGALAGAHQSVRNDDAESGLVKIDRDGGDVEWATWLGGSGVDSAIGSVRVDGSGRPHLAFYTTSTDLPTTATDGGASHHGGEDVYVARLAADGTTVEMGAYLGGSADDGFETHGLGLRGDEVFVGGFTHSSDLATTAGAFQPASGGGLDAFVARLDANGDTIAATYVGGGGGDSVDGFVVAANGEVLFVGETNSDDLPTSSNAFQSARAGDWDAFAIRLGPELDALRYGTYLGGGAHDNGRGATLTDSCEIIVTGASAGPGFPTVAAWQPDFAGGAGMYGNGDVIVAKLALP